MAVDTNNDIHQSTLPQDSVDQANQPPQVNTPISSQKSPKSKLKHKWLWVTIVGIVCIAGATYAYFYLTTIVLVKTPDVSQLQPVYGVDDATTFDSPRALVDAASADLGGIVSVPIVNNYAGLDDQKVAVYKLPYYATAGKPFKNLPYKGNGIAYKGDASQSEVNYTKLVNFFDQNNFKPIVAVGDETSYIAEGIKVNFMNYAVYESMEMVCSIWQADVSSISTPGTNLVSVGCADKANYSIAANDIEPYYASYVKSGGNNENLFFGPPNGADGKDGYMRTDIYQEDSGADAKNKSFVGLYYKVPGSSTWNYFGQHGAKPNQLTACSDFSTTELKKAFAGYNCYDATVQKNATVQ